MFIYNTGENHWDRLNLAAGLREGCAGQVEAALSDSGLRLVASRAVEPNPALHGYDDYVSDPAKPVPLHRRARSTADDHDALEAVAGRRSAPSLAAPTC